jgi:hypothetical protein
MKKLISTCCASASPHPIDNAAPTASAPENHLPFMSTLSQILFFTPDL